MIHATITIVVCVLLFFIHAPLTCYLLPALWYMGREFTQAEYRYIAGYCGNKRANMPWYAGFLPNAWNMKSVFDFFLPLLVSVLFIVIQYLVLKGGLL